MGGLSVTKDGTESSIFEMRIEHVSEKREESFKLKTIISQYAQRKQVLTCLCMVTFPSLPKIRESEFSVVLRATTSGFSVVLEKYSVTLPDRQLLLKRKRCFVHSIVKIRRCVELLNSGSASLAWLNDVWEIRAANAPKCMSTSDQSNHLGCAKTLVGEKSLVRFDILFYDRNTKRPCLKSVYSATPEWYDGTTAGSDSHSHTNSNDIGA